MANASLTSCRGRRLRVVALVRVHLYCEAACAPSSAPPHSRFAARGRASRSSRPCLVICARRAPRPLPPVARRVRRPVRGEAAAGSATLVPLGGSFDFAACKPSNADTASPREARSRLSPDRRRCSGAPRRACVLRRLAVGGEMCSGETSSGRVGLFNLRAAKHALCDASPSSVVPVGEAHRSSCAHLFISNTPPQRHTAFITDTMDVDGAPPSQRRRLQHPASAGPSQEETYPRTAPGSPSPENSYEVRSHRPGLYDVPVANGQHGMPQHANGLGSCRTTSDRGSSIPSRSRIGCTA